MPGGDWLRGVHYWGATAIVIVMALHIVRVFPYAAYRKPRQATWIAGVLLLLCILGFVQTGYLLPWDQKAYWGTAVTIRIVGTAPLIGTKLTQLLQGGGAVGALTLIRFYSIHVVLLPLVTVLLVFLHLFLVRHYGITAPWTDTAKDAPRTVPFYPAQVARDATGMLLILVLVLLLAWWLPAPLARPADPTDTTTVPRPEWFFLFLFQLLHYLPGKWEILGTFVLPTIAIVVLLLLPYIDRNRSRMLKKRPFALIVLFLAIAGWSYLTYASVKDMPRPASWKRPVGIEPPRAERIKRPAEVARLYVLKQNCFGCHPMTLLAGRSNLQSLTRKYFPSGYECLQQHLKEKGRPAELSEKEGTELMSVLRLVASDQPQLLYSIPVKARFGAHMFFNKACINCHRIDGQGGEESKVKAPDLTLRLLRPKSWHVGHIRDAQSVVPDSKMPPFLHYDDYELDALAEYILYLHSP